MKKHKGNGTGKQDAPGRRRGPETGNGRTASTGHTDKGKPTVTFQGQGSVAGQTSRLRTIMDVFKKKGK